MRSSKPLRKISEPKSQIRTLHLMKTMIQYPEPRKARGEPRRKVDSLCPPVVWAPTWSLVPPSPCAPGVLPLPSPLPWPLAPPVVWAPSWPLCTRTSMFGRRLRLSRFWVVVTLLQKVWQRVLVEDPCIAWPHQGTTKQEMH